MFDQMHAAARAARKEADGGYCPGTQVISYYWAMCLGA
jgi:hypothetical protein